MIQRSVRYGLAKRCCTSPSFHGDAKLEREYKSYLSAVDDTVKYDKERKQQARYEEGKPLKMKEMSGRQLQSRELTIDIMNAITGPDDAVLKIRKVSRLFWIAHDSRVALENQYLSRIAAFIMGFVRWPREEARFERHEFLLKLFTYQKEMTNSIEPELATFTIKALASQSRVSLTRGYWNVSRGIINDLTGNWTAPLLGQFFRISSRVAEKLEQPELMENALQTHREYITQDHYKHNSTYYCYLLSGLSKAGMIKEALQLLHTLRGIPVSSVFATICIELCSKSEQPLAAFSMFKAAYEKRSTLTPTVECYSILLLAASRNVDGLRQDHVQFICNDMSERKIRTTDEGFLNRLCISLFAVKKDHIAMSLMNNMRLQKIEIWELTHESIPIHLKEERTAHVLGATVKDTIPAPKGLGFRRQQEAVTTTSDGLQRYQIKGVDRRMRKENLQISAKTAIKSLTMLLKEMPGVCFFFRLSLFFFFY